MIIFDQVLHVKLQDARETGFHYSWAKKKIKCQMDKNFRNIPFCSFRDLNVSSRFLPILNYYCNHKTNDLNMQLFN